MRGIVLGGAACIWKDVDRLEAMIGQQWNEIVVAANDIGCHWPREMHGWCSLHPEKMDQWVKIRERKRLPGGFITYAKDGRKRRGIDATVRHRFGSGSSGLLGVSVALHLGCTKIVLCGIPMTREPYFAESEVHPKGKAFSSADSHWRKWLLYAEKMQGTVKSMSGRTRDLLGEPTLEWLGEDDGKDP